jgi:hypothetical protein
MHVGRYCVAAKTAHPVGFLNSCSDNVFFKDIGELLKKERDKRGLAKYRKTEKGKISQRRRAAKYDRTLKRRLSRRRSNAKYCKTLKGRLSRRRNGANYCKRNPHKV